MPNNVLIKYGSKQTLTITGVPGLASDTNKLTGIETSVIDNTTDGFTDIYASGKITTGTSPTDKREIQVWAIGWDGANWPDVFDGTVSGETITSADIKALICKPVANMSTNNTADRTYHFSNISLRGAFGGALPSKIVLFVTHDTVAALNATAANHELSYYGEYPQIQ